MIYLYLRLILAAIFLTSAISKLQKFEEHKRIVKTYNIIPSRWAAIFSKFDVSTELVIVILLTTGFLANVSLIGAIILLIIYTIAIIINLLRGNTQISCGCGGVVGNHKISWVLVLRNTLFISLALLIFVHYFKLEKNFKWNIHTNYTIEFVWITIYVICTVLIYYKVTAIFTLRKRLNAFFEE